LLMRSQAIGIILIISNIKGNDEQPPNQSLKLTEVAVDDLMRAKQPATIGHDSPRADWIPSLRHFVAAA
jgi:hypothetical protein